MVTASIGNRDYGISSNLNNSVRFRYQTIEFQSADIHLRTLRDRQQFSDDNNVAEKLGISSAMWPYFGLVWPSSEVLAHQMSELDLLGKRVLEVGCGIALPSIILNHGQVDITASDSHPEVGSFLLENVRINNGEHIPFLREDWSDLTDELGKFDVIIGSDLLYDRGSVDLLTGYIEHHANLSCEVIIVDPGRGKQGRFCKIMAELGYTVSNSQPQQTDYLEKPFAGTILRCCR